MQYTSTTTLTGNYIADISFKMKNPDSGFSLAFVKDGGPTDHTGIYFYGHSGYIFDKNGDMVGGYRSGETFNFACHVFDSRYAYYFNEKLCATNISATNPTDYIEYLKGPQSEITIDLQYYV